MANLLFEIGTEELPPGSINGLCTQIKENILKDLTSNGIEVKDSDTQTFYTPRRIAIIIKNLPEQLETKQIEIKGPPREKAYDQSGNPNQTAIGFAKKYNLEPKNLLTKTINGAEYVFLKATTGGQKTKEILTKVLPNSIRQTTGDKFMSWGNYDEKFARPIRWILAILDNEVINFSFAGVASDKYSYGHRFISDKRIEIKKPDNYESELQKHKVIASAEKRKAQIIEELKIKSNGIPGKLIEDQELINEVTNITEFPLGLVCQFDTKFSTLPAEVIKTVLKKHQKCFVFIGTDGSFSNHFIAVTNGISNISIENGNEKVVRARLNDAHFFFMEDLKRPFTFEERIKDLSKITFQKGMGSMEEKTTRIIKLAEKIYNESNNKDINKEDLITVAKLCKLDLSTHMVFELPELQGKIGADYAKLNNYSKQVSEGISEHYDHCPKSTIATIIGIADKLDNLICLFTIGKIPTGSTDPFALRRQAQGIIDSILESPDQLKINISKIIDFYIKEISMSTPKEIEIKIKDFLAGRLAFTMQSRYAASDIVASVCSIGDPLTNLDDTNEKIKSLSIYFADSKHDNFNTFLVSAKRLVRIVEAKANGSLDSTSLKTDYEMQLLKRFEELDKINPKPYHEFLNKLTTLTNPINTFFDKVLVNDPDPKIKQARQALLKRGKDLFEKICDFNQIIERN